MQTADLSVEERERVGPRTDHGIAFGAVFSFMAWITTREDFEIGEHQTPETLLARFKDWSASHGIDPDEVQSLVATWDEGRSGAVDWREAARRWHDEHRPYAQGSEQIDSPQ